MATLTVKAYLETIEARTTGASPEIRRFPANQELLNNYEKLQRKLVDIFPSLHEEKKYKTYWKDSDDDMIAFSSNDELKEAASFAINGIFRIFIRELASGASAKPADSMDAEASADATPRPGDADQQPQAGPSGTSGDEGSTEGNPREHRGITCDGCNGKVIGIRYKCMICPDYDLCEMCEQKGVHVDTSHTMVKILDPDQPQGPFGFGFGCPPHFRKWKKFAKHHGPGFGGPWMFGGRGGGGSCGWAWGWSGATDGCHGQGQSATADSSGQQKQQQEGGAHAAGAEGQQHGQSQAGAHGEAWAQYGDELLRNIGHTVAAVLDPFGIDVHVDVETPDGETSHCAGTPRQPTAASKTGADKQQGEKTASPPPDSQAPRAAATAQPMDTDEETGQTATTTPTSTVTDKQKSPPPPAAAGGGGGAGGGSEGRGGSERDDGWITVESGEVQADSGPSPSPAQPTQPAAEPTAQGSSDQQQAGSGTSVYPELPADSDTRVAETLAQLQAMGFSDEGGWLTRLVEVKAGNIADVLETIFKKK